MLEGQCVPETTPLPQDFVTAGCPGGEMRQVQTTKKYKWADKTRIDWQPIDMTSDVTPALPQSHAFQRATQGIGHYRGRIETDPAGDMWIPVVEVQSVLRNDACVRDPKQCP